MTTIDLDFLEKNVFIGPDDRERIARGEKPFHNYSRDNGLGDWIFAVAASPGSGKGVFSAWQNREWHNPLNLWAFNINPKDADAICIMYNHWPELLRLARLGQELERNIELAGVTVRELVDAMLAARGNNE